MRIGAIKTPTIIVTTVGPRLLIGGLAGMPWVSYFTLAQRFMGLSTMLMQGVGRTSMPALAEQRAKRDLAGFKRLFLRTTLMTGAAISGLVLIGLPFVESVVGFLWPPDFAEPVALCCMILAIGVVPSSFAVAIDPFYILCDRMRQNLTISFVALAVTIPTNVVLVYMLPTTGAVWAHTVYMCLIVSHFIYIAHYFRNVSATDDFWKQ
jgi:O-antigen/teichoic acid export membrane protein